MSQEKAQKLYIAAFDKYYYEPSELNFVKYCYARFRKESITLALQKPLAK
jgi:hypothetical protein